MDKEDLPGYDQFLDAVTFDYVDDLETTGYDQELEVPKWMKV